MIFFKKYASLHCNCISTFSNLQSRVPWFKESISVPYRASACTALFKFIHLEEFVPIQFYFEFRYVKCFFTSHVTLYGTGSSRNITILEHDNGYYLTISRKANIQDVLGKPPISIKLTIRFQMTFVTWQGQGHLPR